MNCKLVISFLLKTLDRLFVVLRINLLVWASQAHLPPPSYSVLTAICTHWLSVPHTWLLSLLWHLLFLLLRKLSLHFCPWPPPHPSGLGSGGFLRAVSPHHLPKHHGLPPLAD